MSSPATQVPESELLEVLDPERFDVPTEDDLPFKDGRMRNFTESFQTELLTECSRPVLAALHADGNYLIGADSAIYYRVLKPFDQSKNVAPDWFYIPGATQTNARGRRRKSYLSWESGFFPMMAIGYSSNGGAEERDPTPDTGKFWIYEHHVRPAFYAIFVPTVAELEVYELVHHAFVPVKPNEAGRYPIPPMRMELGVWHGTLERTEDDWIRWWSPDGVMLPSDLERAEEQQRRAEEQQRRADAAVSDNERLRAMLREMGRDPDAG